jgi:hypothetical protein
MAGKVNLINLPHPIDTTLYLIREELKSQKFFNTLHKAGIDDCYYQPRLDKLILRQLGMDDGSDEVFELFYRIIEKRLRKVKPNNESITKQAMRVYVDLVRAKSEL